MSFLLALAMIAGAIPAHPSMACPQADCGGPNCPMGHEQTSNAAPAPMRADHSCCSKAQKGQPPIASVESAKSVPGSCRCVLKASTESPLGSSAAVMVPPTMPAIAAPIIQGPHVSTLLSLLAEPGHYANDSGPPDFLIGYLSHLRAPPM